MSSAHEPIGLVPSEIEAAAADIINGDREATRGELVATFRICVDNHYLAARDAVCHALGAAIDWEGDQ